MPGDGGERDPDGDCSRDAAGRAQQPREAGRHQRAPQLTRVHQGKLREGRRAAFHHAGRLRGHSVRGRSGKALGLFFLT